MPSLRRTVSSPPARRGPYSYPSSLSQGTPGSATRPGAHNPRRSSGSDVNNRRVLADIDWWIVQDGQRDDLDAYDQRDAPDAAEREGEPAPAVAGVAAPTPLVEHDLDHVHPMWQLGPQVGSGAGAVENISFPAPSLGDIASEVAYGFRSLEALSPIPQFVDLSITPSTRHIHSPDASFSDSSLQSTPSSAHFALLPVSALAFDDTRFMDFEPFALPAGPSVRRSATGMTRSASYSFVEDELSYAVSRRREVERFDDVPSTPCLSPFFSLTRTDVDDLFY